MCLFLYRGGYMNILKNFFIYCVFIILSSDVVYSLTLQDGITFFEKYQQYSNSYNTSLLEMYSNNAKIIREVIKPSGNIVSVNIPTQRFFKELKIGQKTAKIKRYRNSYRNVTVKSFPNGIKITAERQPIKENYWLKMYQILQDTESGIKITEEMMQTKVQLFLNK